MCSSFHDGWSTDARLPVAEAMDGWGEFLERLGERIRRSSGDLLTQSLGQGEPLVNVRITDLPQTPIPCLTATLPFATHSSNSFRNVVSNEIENTKNVQFSVDVT